MQVRTDVEAARDLDCTPMKMPRKNRHRRAAERVRGFRHGMHVNCVLLSVPDYVIGPL